MRIRIFHGKNLLSLLIDYSTHLSLIAYRYLMLRMPWAYMIVSIFLGDFFSQFDIRVHNGDVCPEGIDEVRTVKADFAIFVGEIFLAFSRGLLKEIFMEFF